MARHNGRVRSITAALLGLTLLLLLAADGRYADADARLSVMPAPLVPAAAAWGPGAVANGFVRARRADGKCVNPLSGIRNGPNKYLLGRCATAPPTAQFFLPPTRRLLPEAQFASLIAEDTCNTARCAAPARAGHGRWVLVEGLRVVRPRTTRWCPRYRNLDFATDRPARGDRLVRRIPPGTPVRWRYASRGGRWVMTHWSAGGRYSWAFIPRTCVADPPRSSSLGLWRWRDASRPTTGHRFRVLRRALPCPSRLRCAVG